MIHIYICIHGFFSKSFLVYIENHIYIYLKQSRNNLETLCKFSKLCQKKSMSMSFRR